MWAPIKKLKQKQQGFTIIEVMIVLAVAATIMLIVFLAVPALQRNTANNQRANDASKVASGVNECLSNRNDTPSSCNTAAQVVGVTLDTSTLQKLTTVAFPAGAAAFPADTATANVFFGYNCNNTRSGTNAGNSTDFVVLYNAQSSAGGNVNECTGE